ncbi:MAG TPA: type IV toxin-antitoxin system AbiEi family antitoxin domain-containing protein [Polyangiaceae bacterium]|nr:type IV toxin-antitoxin system AbiEi family antitoxin domain-containing protein [Polyangiaceae bacterium]
MPRPSATGSAPDWNRLFELASAQGGYFTNAQAAAAGYSPPLLQFYVKKGRLERIRRGILRLVHYPTGDDEDLMPLWLWSDRKGVFSHETALMMNMLSDALPAKRHMTLPTSWSKRRLRVPKGVVVHYDDVPKSDVTWFGPVRVTTPLRAVVDAVRAHVAEDIVRQAVEQGIRRGLFERATVNAALRRARKERDAAAAKLRKS